MRCFRRECPPTAHLLRQMGMAARPIYGHFFSLSLRWFCPELWSVLRKIARALKALPNDTVIDCEIVAFGDDCYTHASRRLHEGFVSPHVQWQDQQSSRRSRHRYFVSEALTRRNSLIRSRISREGCDIDSFFIASLDIVQEAPPGHSHRCVQVGASKNVVPASMPACDLRSRPHF